MKTPLNFFRYLCIVLSIWLLAACAGMKPNPQFREKPSNAAPPARTEGRALRRARNDGSFEREMKQEIQKYMGVPYRWGGATTAGMDCSGFVSTVFHNAVELKLPHNARRIHRLGQSVDREDLRFGDLVFFQDIESAGISHVGIYVGEDQFAHASTTRGVTISSLNMDYYRSRYAGARRVQSR